MKEELILLIIYISTLSGFLIYSLGNYYGYKSGQTDAIIGHIKYELVIQVDSTRKWIKIDGVK